MGLGSVAFHATLLYEHQMLDELPMLWSAICMVYILLEFDAPADASRFGPALPLYLTLHGAATTYLVATTGGSLQFYLFHASFGSAEFWCLYQIWKLRTASSRLAAGFRFYLVALVCWSADLTACGSLSALPANPQLHAWWHILVSSGMYCLTLLVGVARQRVLKQPVVVGGSALLPHLALAPSGAFGGSKEA